MSTNLDPRIDAYIAKSADFARPILRHLRALVHRACPDVEETIKWGMPFFTHRGGILCNMAAFKAHCAFGFWNRAMRRVIGDEARADSAMGSFGRIASRADLPPDKDIVRWMRAAVKLNGAATSALPAKPKRVAKARAMPADLAAALKQDRRAATAFARFSPSHRNEYIEWITEAKRPATRRRRLETTLEWLAEGKSRNWQYERR